MKVTISRDDIFFVGQVMNSQGTDGLHGYIDCETGEVLVGSLDYLVPIVPDEESEDYEQLRTEFEHRYLQIPQEGSRDSYQDMVDFIETVEDKLLQELLKSAIKGKGAFGRFKDTLKRSEYAAYLSRWYALSEKRIDERVIEWLIAQGFSVAE